MPAPANDRAVGEPSLARGLVPALAALFVVLAVATDPGAWWRMGVVAAPVALFAAWYVRPVPVSLLAVVVIVSVVVAQWHGELEVSMFLVSLLALAASAWGPWGRTRPASGLVLAACVLTPGVLSVIRPEADIFWAPWTGGVVFPAVMGWSIRRQERLTDDLARARRELADRAVLDERRRIARDVHDLVGHGLAAIMLQITSARHVLRRSPESAEEALASAEAVGRASMQDLRRTVGLLRDADEDPGNGSLPDAARIAELVTTFRAAGLDLAFASDGDLDTVDPAVGLTLYRIAQEALANAAKHSPRAPTTIRLAAAADAVTLDVATKGAASHGPAHGAPADAATAHYGLRGMRERADIVGAVLTAGPTDAGWLVRCVVPRTQPANRVQQPAVDR